jgi:hypothetical protein
VYVSMIARVLWLRRGLRGHERWTQAQLEAHQRRELAALRAFAANAPRSTRTCTAAWTTPRSGSCR